jgi:OTU domain-containing protein 5
MGIEEKDNPSNSKPTEPSKSQKPPPQSPNLHLLQPNNDIYRSVSSDSATNTDTSPEDIHEEHKTMQIEGVKHPGWEIGENIDCLDTVNHWLNAEIIGIRKNAVRVHFNGWAPKFDEWIDNHSDRLLKQWQRGMEFSLHHRLDIVDERHEWLEARIVDIRPQQILIHYYGFSKKFDEWIMKSSDRIAEVGSHSKAYGAAKFREANMKSAHMRKNMKQYIDEDSFQKKLVTKGLLIKQVGGDGNCLFRSFSDQLYGNEDWHREIREICMEYITIERDFFKNFVVGGDFKFDEYVEKKRQDSCWGDDVEIQALSEMYNRAIEIYAYSSDPMRTFHESGSNTNEPIRLSYHGKSHYNSIKKLGKENEGMVGMPFGQIEDITLRNAKLRAEKRKEQQQNNVIMISNNQDEMLNAIIGKSREEFENNGKRDMEAALEESLALYEQEVITNVHDDELESVIKMSLDKKEDDELLNMIITESKMEEERQNENILKQVLNESQKISDDPMMNPTIQEVVSLGFPLDLVVIAYSMFGDDPNSIVNFISENYGIFQ